MAKDSIPPQESSNIMSLPTPPLKKASEYLNSYNSWVYTCVNAIAEQVSSIKLHLYKKKYTQKGVEITEIFDHEALSLLHEVNNFMTSYQLLEITQVYLELTGEAYWCIIRGAGGKPQQLWPLRPDWVYINTSKSDFIESYSYGANGANDPNSVKIPKTDVIPFKYLNPTNPYRGRGAVQAAAMAVDTDTFSAEWNRNFFFNSAVPYLILRTKKKPKKEEVDRFMASWQAKFQGKANSHKIAMLTGEWEDPFVFGDKFKDMDFIEQRKLMRDEILAMFRVGKSTLNLTEDVNRANAFASNRNFLETVITPKMRRLVAHLNEFYIKSSWPDEDIFFDFEDPAPADVELNLKIYESGKGYWLTPNEIREKENLPPMEGGDIIPVAIQAPSAPSDATNEDGSPKEEPTKQIGIFYMENKNKTPKARKFMMPITPKSLMDIRKEDMKNEIKRDLFKLVKNLIVEVDKENQSVNKRVIKGSGWTQEKRDNHWEKMIAKTDVYEAKWLDLQKQLFAEQREEVLKNLNTSKAWVKHRRKGKESSIVFDVKLEDKKAQKLLLPLARRVVEEKGREVLEDLGIEGSLQIDMKRQKDNAFNYAADYLKKRAVEFIHEINAYTIERLRAVLSEGFLKEESIDQLAKRVEDVFDVAIGSRAQKIARTEIIRASNAGTLEAYKQSRVVVAKEWLTAKDARVDDRCKDLDGKVTDVDGDFKEGEFSGKYPPLHPNCRCTLIPVLQGDKSLKSKVRDVIETNSVDALDGVEVQKLADELIKAATI